MNRSGRHGRKASRRQRRAKEEEKNSVEHAVVGKHRFPLFSHPAFRAQIADERYISDSVDAVLRDPDMLDALNAYVEQMLMQGRDTVSEEDLEALLLQHTTQPTMSASESDDPLSVPGLAARSVPPPSITAPRSREVRQPAAIGAARSWKPTEARAHRLAPIAVDIMDKTTARLTRDQRFERAPSRESAAEFVSTHTSTLLTPPMEPAVVSAVDFSNVANSSDGSVVDSTVADSLPATVKRGSTFREATGSTGVAPSDATREVVRVAVYSVLQQKLSASSAALSMQDIARAKAHQGAIDSQQLHSFPSNAYATLDIGMDGNSTCISRRPKPQSISPTQLTNILLASGQLRAGKRATTSQAASLPELRRTGEGPFSAATTSLNGAGSSSGGAKSTMSTKGRKRGATTAAAKSSTALLNGSEGQTSSDVSQSSCHRQFAGGSDAPRGLALGQFSGGVFPPSSVSSRSPPVSSGGELPAGAWGARRGTSYSNAGENGGQRRSLLRSHESGEALGGVRLQVTQQAAWEKALLCVRRSAV